MSLKHRFRQIKKLPTWIYWVPSRFIMLLAKIMRHATDDPEGLVDKYTMSDDKKAVAVTWHNRLLFFAAVFPKRVRLRTVAVISASRDGQYIADLVSMFGVQSVRGSSSRKGANVLHAAMKTIKGGSLIAMTPDGPRGPKYKLSRGPIHMASSLGVPIIPVLVNYSSYWSLGSWDGFQIPKPWAKITLVVGEEIFIPADLDNEQFEEYRKKVEAGLMKICKDKPEK